MIIIEDSCELINQIVYGAIEYADNLGFSPHKDFSLSKYILGVPIEPTKKIRFGGPDGKPLYILGPEDDPQEIIQRLTEEVGENGFEYILAVPEGYNK